MATRVSEHSPVTGKPNERSVADLVRELRDETTMLIQQELALARAEATEKVNKFVRNVAFVGAGAMVLYAGFIFILLACSDGLVSALTEWGTDPDIAIWVAPLVVGAVVGITGYAFLQKGISTLRNEPVIPRKTVESLKEDKEWVKHKLA